MTQHNKQEIRINGQIYTPDQLHLMDGEYSDLRLFLEAWWSPQPQMEVQTSGSTGQPKKIFVSKAAMLDSAIRTLRFFDLQAGQRALLCLPLHYIAGKMMVVRALAGQLNLVLRTPSGLPLGDLEERVDFAAFSPLQMLNELERQPSRLHLLDKVLIGGGKVDEVLGRLLQRQSFAAYESYGMTETLSHIALRRINGPQAQKHFVALQGVEIRCNKEDCLELQVAGLTRGWLSTNDLVKMHDNNSFEILGRTDNVINSGGLKILPEQLEVQLAPLLPLPFYLTWRPHARLGQQLVLVSTRYPADHQKLFQKIKEVLPRYQRPAEWLLVPDFPLTHSGKIQRQQLAELVQKTTL